MALGERMAFKRGHLRYFVAVADDGQITRAAAKLHIAQPALSQAISQLESQLGVRLFERHGRGVTLTPAGAAFLPKARTAVASQHDLATLAQSLRRADAGIIEVGFIGPPPTMNAPELFDAFAVVHPEIEVSFRDLPFPHEDLCSWLADVDVAFCHAPAVGGELCVQPVRSEPRAVVAHKTHPLADRAELAVAEVLDETFLRYDPAVQASWAGFHSLDDHRGGPPRSLTLDRICSSLQMLGVLTTGRGITTAPFSDARFGPELMPDLVAIPVHDAEPAVLSLVWAAGDAHPAVRELAATAKGLGADGAARR